MSSINTSLFHYIAYAKAILEMLKLKQDSEIFKFVQ